MLKRTFAAGALAIALIPGPVWASDWWFVVTGGHAPRRSIELMDKSSIRAGIGKTIRVWAQTFEEQPHRGVRVRKSLVEFDCLGRTSHLLSWVTYGEDLAVLSSGSSDYSEDKPDPIVPDSVGDAELSFVCGKNSEAYHIGEVHDFPAVARQIIAELDKPGLENVPPSDAKPR